MKTLRSLVSVLIMLIHITVASASLKISNKHLSIVYNSETNALSVVSKTNGLQFIDDKWCDRFPSSSEIKRINHPIFGNGKVIGP